MLCYVMLSHFNFDWLLLYSSEALESHKKSNHPYRLCHHCTCVYLLSCRVYSNSLLMGLSKFRLSTIQPVLNAAARLITRLPRCTIISTYMTKMLQWLTIASRIKFKVLLLVSKSQLGLAPN